MTNIAPHDDDPIRQRPQKASAAEGDHFDTHDGAYGEDEYYGESEVDSYRVVSRTAIVSFGLAVFSGLVFIFPIFFVLSAIALALSVFAITSIRRYPDELVGYKIAVSAALLSLLTMVGGFSYHAVVYMTEVPEGYIRINFGDLRPQELSPFPISKRALELSGEKVFIKGYVYPHLRKVGLTKFLLVRDKGTCCFGGDPKPYDCVIVDLEDGKTIDYSWRLRNLGGVFEIDQIVKKLDKVEGGLYRLQGDYVK